jgi:hypothetical protein
MLFDCPQAKGAVRALSREHDAYGKLAPVFSEGDKETVNRHPPAARLGRCLYYQGAVPDRQCRIGRDDVDPVRLDLRLVQGLLHGHPGMPREELGQGAFVIGRQMHDNGKSDSRVRRHVPEECFVRVKAAGGSTDRCDKKMWWVALAHSLLRFSGGSGAFSHENHSVRLAVPFKCFPPTKAEIRSTMSACDHNTLRPIPYARKRT